MSCVVEGCKAHSSRKENVNELLTFHRFPNDENVRKIWTSKVDRPNWKPTKYSRICSKHFPEDCFVPNSNIRWRRLKPDAIPTLYLNNITSSHVAGTLSLTETNESLPEPTTSRQYQDRMEPFTEINTGNKIQINLKRKFSSTELGTSTEEAEMDIASAKKMKMLEKKVENLKRVNLRSRLPTRAKLGVYKTYVRSRLTYAAPAWYALVGDCNRKRLDAQQSLSLRATVDAPRYVRNEVIARDLGVEPLGRFIEDLATRMFGRADRSRFRHLSELAPYHRRPPDKKGLPRDLARATTPPPTD
ncbi:hypothetical protein MSG28_011214 [Choristoneura fumiferana]|uniref:Uncharacterized protein n=1 Tax=Choristoneura fumiferana TaxID=7141 RepID=A0ACC0KQU3_CHOFU|nr:hypothetical protein MSG28_011214 [Choristoneura fumiferana]